MLSFRQEVFIMQHIRVNIFWLVLGAMLSPFILWVLIFEIIPALFWAFVAVVLFLATIFLSMFALWAWVVMVFLTVFFCAVTITK